MAKDILTEVLNKAQALVESGIVTYAQIAKESAIPPRTLYQWFGNNRRYRPDEGAMKLYEWLTRKTLQIAKANNRAMQACYRSKYLEIEKRFPATGTLTKGGEKNG